MQKQGRQLLNLNKSCWKSVTGDTRELGTSWKDKHLPKTV